MENVYTISTVDSQDYKRLACGRTNDIAALIDHISQGHSVALFGERRIGKTTVLFLLRDIVNHQIDHYQPRLIDSAFRNAIPTLKAKAHRCQSVYINLQGQEPTAFASRLVDELSSHSPKTTPHYGKPHFSKVPLVEFVREVNNNLPDTARLVIVLDEIESLLDSWVGKQSCRSLRTIVQSCPKICFVVAGAELWHKSIAEKSSPLVNNVFVAYLRSAEAYAIEEYLVRQQLAHYLSPGNDIESIVRKIRDWTGGKPWYVQAVCYELVEACGDAQQLPPGWEEIVEAKVMTAIGPTLRAFFEGDRLDDITRKILALLANKHGLGVKEIAGALGVSEKAIWHRVADLEALDTVRKRGSEYYIAGTMLEKYGKQNQELPHIRSKWSQHLKWVSAAVLVCIAISLYVYTHPALHTYTVTYPGGIVGIRMPSRLEQEEAGAAFISIRNTTASETYSITMSLLSNDIDYQHNDTNSIVFESLRASEMRYWEPTFTARASTGAVLSSNITITRGTDQVATRYTFDISQRAVPVKKYWAVVSVLLVTISGFLTKQDLSQLIASIFSGLLKGQGDAEK